MSPVVPHSTYTHHSHHQDNYKQVSFTCDSCHSKCYVSIKDDDNIPNVCNYCQMTTCEKAVYGGFGIFVFIIIGILIVKWCRA